MRTCTSVLLWLSFCLAQSSSIPPAFEVVSIKPSAPDSRGMNVSTGPGRFTAENVTLKFLIQGAYHVREEQISGGPKWLDAERYDVAATAAGSPTDAETRQMMQPMLAERFQLKAHRTTREASIYQLTVARGGLKIQPVDDSTAKGRASVARGRIAGQKVSMAQLAGMLSTALSQTVSDGTDAKGLFDVNLAWTPDESQPVLTKPEAAPPEPVPAETGGLSIFGALQEQLGLRLEVRQGTAEVLVVDTAERPGAN